MHNNCIMVFHRYVKKPIPIRAEKLSRSMDIDTLEGVFHGKKGDYHVIGVKGEHYIVDKEIFELTYDIYTDN